MHNLCIGSAVIGRCHIAWCSAKPPHVVLIGLKIAVFGSRLPEDRNCALCTPQIPDTPMGYEEDGGVVEILSILAGLSTVGPLNWFVKWSKVMLGYGEAEVPFPPS